MCVDSFSMGLSGPPPPPPAKTKQQQNIYETKASR